MKILLLIAIILLCFTSCAELIDVETREVEATITDVYYKGSWIQMIPVGKSVVSIFHQARYKVTFTYEDVTLTVDDKELYDCYKDKIGAMVKCDLITEYYDDGSIEQTLKLKEKEIR